MRSVDRLLRVEGPAVAPTDENEEQCRRLANVTVPDTVLRMGGEPTTARDLVTLVRTIRTDEAGQRSPKPRPA